MDYFGMLPWEIVENVYESMTLKSKSSFAMTCKSHYQYFKVYPNLDYIIASTNRTNDRIYSIKVMHALNKTMPSHLQFMPLYGETKLGKEPYIPMDQFLEKHKFTSYYFTYETYYLYFVLFYQKKPAYIAKIRLFNNETSNNIELQISTLFSHLVVKKSTPHLLLPVGSFRTDTDFFTKIDNIQRDYLYDLFMTDYNEKKFLNTVSVILYEYCDEETLEEFLVQYGNQVSLPDWTVILFQIIYTLCTIQKNYPTFRHNRLDLRAILVNTDREVDRKKDRKQIKCRKYKYFVDEYEFVFPNIGMETRLWNFDFASIDGMVKHATDVETSNTSDTSNTSNRYYDLRTFIYHLMNYINNFDIEIPTKIKEFVERIVPDKYQGKNGDGWTADIELDCEYKIPYDILVTDPLFEKYRRKINNN